MKRPGHLANASPAAGAPPPVDGLDLTLAAQNVRRAGGDPSRFAGSLAAALREDPEPGRPRALAFAALAAWRAGALVYRDDALARLDGLLTDGAGLAAARALGLDTASLAATFGTAQRTDRFWWPGRAEARGYVCAVGGFAGVGGAWVAPPDEGFALAQPGAFAIRTGDEWWRLDADVWGSQLRRIDGEPPAAASDSLASIVCTADSYLAWVHVRDAA